MVALVGKFQVAESLKHFQVSLFRVVAPQSLIHYQDIICSDQIVIHRNEVVDGDVNEAEVREVVCGLFASILFQILAFSIVKGLELADFPAFIELLDHVQREPKEQQGVHQLSTLKDHRIPHRLPSKHPLGNESQQIAQSRKVSDVFVDLEEDIHYKGREGDVVDELLQEVPRDEATDRDLERSIQVQPCRRKQDSVSQMVLLLLDMGVDDVHGQDHPSK
mmetsp:Transcript_35736/g.34767  ORF Transcript_35736/g.34767 Transcript_35736/m.34767 type:complete len:220 (+) Transcript_35736:139-798(+)